MVVLNPKGSRVAAFVAPHRAVHSVRRARDRRLSLDEVRAARRDPPGHIVSRASPRSATRSSTASSPTLRRTMSLGTSLLDARRRGVGHPAGMLDQALHATEALGQREDAGPGADLERRPVLPPGGEADHAAEGPDLAAGDLVAGVGRAATGCRTVLDRRVVAQEIHDGEGVGSSGVPSEWERHRPPVDQEAVQGARNRPGRSSAGKPGAAPWPGRWSPRSPR